MLLSLHKAYSQGQNRFSYDKNREKIRFLGIICRCQEYYYGTDFQNFRERWYVSHTLAMWLLSSWELPCETVDLYITVSVLVLNLLQSYIQMMWMGKNCRGTGVYVLSCVQYQHMYTCCCSNWSLSMIAICSYEANSTMMGSIQWVKKQQCEHAAYVYNPNQTIW